MTLFSFPAVQAGDAVTVEIINGVGESLQDFADGVAGAPRIKGAALADEDDFVVSVTASDDYTLTRGLNVVTGQTTNNTGSYVVGYTITVLSYTGSIRFSVTISASDANADHDLRIIKESGGSSTILQTFSGSGLNDSRTIDVPVAVGDVITWEHKDDGGLATTTLSSPVQSADARLVEYTAIDEGA